MTLTIAEIKDLAQFAGLALDKTRSVSGEELYTEITVEACPPHGIDDEGERLHYRRIAHLTEYPDEGCCGLGPLLDI